MYDVSLLNILKNKEMFNRVYPHIKEYSVSKDVYLIIKGIESYWENYPTHKDVDWPTFRMFFSILHGASLKEEKAVVCSAILEKAEKEDKEGLSSVVFDDILAYYIRKDYATRIANEAIGIAQDVKEKSMDAIDDMLKEYNKEVGRTILKSDLFVPTDLSYLETTCAADGLHWRLNELNKSAGPLRKGDFVILAARPETGKTTFVASEVANFASQLHATSGPVVWVNNEEASGKVMLRIIQSYFGVPLDVLKSDIDGYNKKYKAEMGERILVVADDSGMNDVKRLTGLFSEVEPSLIVFDQLDKVHGFTKESRDDLRIGKLYEWGRNLAKQYGPTIAVSQASEAADHVKWITQSMLRGSKTDKAGEADLIITIGRDGENELARYIHLPKNKLMGGPVSEELYRHGFFEVSINPVNARYEGVL